ncbi:hypothetical protein BH11MYX1_BH11MYX1_01040 [soil metagenome]
MKTPKLVTAALGLLFVIAIFLPFVSLGDAGSVSLWGARQFKSGPTYIILIASLVVLGLSILAVRGRLGRGLAAGIAFASFVVAFIAFVQFNSHKGMGGNASMLMDLGGIGAKLLVFGGCVAMFAAIAGLVKPERRVA